MVSQYITKSISYCSFERVDLLQYANEQRKQGFFNDVTIEVENDFMPANRMVLSCYSDFFKKMFSSRMKEQYENSVKVSGVDKTSMKHIIEYIYTGRIIIDDENVIDLLSAADYLNLDTIKRFCSEFLESAVMPASCLFIWKTADMYRDEFLKNKISIYMSLNFHDVIEDQTFKALSRDDLTSCISSLDRDLLEETLVYEAVITWINYDEEKRKEYFPDILQLVEFDKFSCEFLAAVVCAEKLVKENLICSNLAMEALAKTVRGKFAHERFPQMFALVCTSDKTLKLCEFDHKFNKIDKNYTKLPQFDHDARIFKVRNFLYCGIDAKLWRLNLNHPLQEWIQVEDISSIWYTIYKSYLVISTMDFVARVKLDFREKPNIQSNKWVVMPSLHTSRYAHTFVSVGDILYALGGIDATSVCCATVECLSSVSKSWRHVPSMNKARSFFAAVRYEESIYVMGGENDEGLNLKCVEKFDPTQNRWTFVKDMQLERHDHAACVLHGKIFVTGGLNAQNERLTKVECYDISLDTWSIVTETFPEFNYILSLTA